MKTKSKKPQKTPQELIREMFPEFLKVSAEKFTTVRIAKECGVTTRCVNKWMLGIGKPNYATMRGVQEIINTFQP